MESCALREMMASRRASEAQRQQPQSSVPPAPVPDQGRNTHNSSRNRARPGEMRAPTPPPPEPYRPESYHIPHANSSGPFYVVLEGRDVGVWSGWYELIS